MGGKPYTKKCECGIKYKSKGGNHLRCPLCNAKMMGQKEAAFVNWVMGQGIEYYLLRHGEVYRLRKDYNDWILESGGRFDDRVMPGHNLPPLTKRRERMLFYQTKLCAIQYDGFDEWEMHRAVAGILAE